jgi:beta-carotene hydroxylase
MAGPVYLPWLWLWSVRRAHAHHERLWIAVETCLVVAFWAVALLHGHTVPALLVYAALLYLASWLFPLGLVYLQHDPRGRDALRQTRRYRGRVVPMLLLQHLYHLEHHLYPMVPVQHWRALAHRLDPHLDTAGVPVVSIP